MIDFSKYFTDPSAQVYDTDAAESALWQQSSTNPFAVLHALAARRNANNRRDQYAEVLAQKDARAVSGASKLMGQEFRQNIPLEYIKRGELDPSFGMDLAGLRMANGEVDPRIRRQSLTFQAKGIGDAAQSYGAGIKSLGDVGLQPENAGAFTKNYLGIGDLVDVLTPNEREQKARTDAEMGTQTVTDTFVSPLGADRQRTVQTRVPLDPTFLNGKKGGGVGNVQTNVPEGGPGVTNAGTGNKAAPVTTPSDVPPASTKKNAPGYAPAAEVIPAGPVRADALQKAPPPQQQALLTVRKQGLPTARGTYVFEQNSVQSDGEGNLYFNATLSLDGKKDTLVVGITPEGKAFLAK